MRKLHNKIHFRNGYAKDAPLIVADYVRLSIGVCPYPNMWGIKNVFEIHFKNAKRVLTKEENFCEGCRYYTEDSLEGSCFSEHGCIREGTEMSEKNKPKRDGSGKGTRANRGRGGCASTPNKGKGRK